MKNKWIKMYMDFAIRASEESYSRRTGVGSIFLSSNGVMSIGINGMPPGEDNNCEIEVSADADYPGDEQLYSAPGGSHILETKPEVCHAEINLFSKMLNEGLSSKNGTLFITLAPCLECSKIIFSSGIKTVYYKDSYRISDGVEWLSERIEVIQVDKYYH